MHSPNKRKEEKTIMKERERKTRRTTMIRMQEGKRKEGSVKGRVNN
jgi:hypothetical protein